MSLENNKEYSEKRLSKVEKEIKSLDIVESLSNVCIYVCGSYGRMEANSNSDLDLFFIDFDTQIKKKTYKEDDKRTLDNDLKNILRKMKFPEFSNDGEYLKVHSLNKILTELGGRNDDYENFFTTRLLLILESVPLFNKKI